MFNTRPLVKFSVNHPWIIIIGVLAITIVFALPLGSLKIQADVASLLPEEIDGFGSGDESVAASDLLLIMVKGDNLYTVENLQLLEATVQEISEKLPVLDTVDPFSMMTIEKAGARLMAVSMSPGGHAPATPEELEVFKNRLEASRFAKGAVVSEDSDALAYYLMVEKSDAYLAQMEAVDRIIEPLEQSLEVSVTGTSPFSAETERFLTTDFAKLLIFVIITILISYFIGFRSKRAVFLPILLVLSGMVVSLGIMSLAGFELTMVSILSPPLILTLGSSYSIHVMNAYYNEASKGAGKDKKKMIIDSVSGISGTVMLASLTTLIGLASLLLATISQTREFAIATALGIFFSAVLSVTLLPAFLSLQKIPKLKRLKALNNDPLSRFLRRFGPGIAKAGRLTVIVIAAVIVLFIFITPRLEFNTSPSKYFPSSSPVIVNLNNFLGEMGGYEELEIKLKGQEEDYFLSQDVLENVNKIEQQLAANPNISYIFSFPQYLEYASGIMTGMDNNFSSKGLNRFVSRIFKTVDEGNVYAAEDFSEMKITIRVFNAADMMPVDEKDTRQLKEQLFTMLNAGLLETTEWELEGSSLGFLKLSDQMRRDFLVSTLAALILIAITGAITFRSVVKGLLTIVPLLMGICCSMILMVIFGIPLDMTTIMVSCLTIGVGVDDAIHFLLQHKKYQAESDDAAEAVQQTLLHAGRPIVITTLSIVAGLIFLAFAQFQPIKYFGLLIVFTLLTACLSTILLLPSLTRLTVRKKND
ncbi:MAG: MMPL family transporter [Spirochaetales bacterium]|uniref:MMPL family transporter n=1 Tax=Candidatus Thalassospirochaeta sargassi TaxID=3119039 RepID=A0AAJ1MK92_9SPIO|nr:MMPL family transporter [Spirochaetales bacterium]